MTDARVDDIPSGRPTTERVRGIFSELAGRYDLLNTLTSGGLHHCWRWRTVREAAVKPDSVVLDLAAGTGELSLDLARRGQPAEILATDFVPEMLEVAKRKARSYSGPTRLRFEVQDAQALTLPDEAYDIVTIAFGVRNLPDRAANFAEVLRVLKRGGRYLVLEFSRPQLWFRPIYYLHLKTVLPGLGFLLAPDPSSYIYLNDSIRQFPPQQVLADELLAAGFRDVYWRDLMFGGVALHVATK